MYAYCNYTNEEFAYKMIVFDEFNEGVLEKSDTKEQNKDKLLGRNPIQFYLRSVVIYKTSLMQNWMFQFEILTIHMKCIG